MMFSLSSFKTELKIVGLLICTLVTTFNSYSQETEDDDDIDLLLDELFFSEDQFIDDILDLIANGDFIYTNISFHDNTYFSGRRTRVDQFNIIPQLSYYHHSGFNLSISGVYYQNFDPNWDFTDISIGYYNTIGEQKQAHFDIGYTRYIYSDGWDTFTNSLDAGFGFRNAKRSVGTKLSASYLFGKDQSIQLVSSSYARLTLVKDKRFVLRFKPQLNFIIAQQILAIRLIDDQGNPEIRFNEVFGLLNTQINLPVTFSTRSWDLELGYNFNFPSSFEGESNLKSTDFLNVSIGYLFDLKAKR